MAADRGTNQQGKKVVATSPGVSMWPAPTTTFDPNARGSADRLERSAELDATSRINNAPFYSGGATPEQRTAYNMQQYGSPYAPTTTADSGTSSVTLTDPYASLLGGFGGGGSSDPRTNKNALEWLKYQNELASATEQKKINAAKYKAMQDYYNTGDWRNMYDTLGGNLDTMQTQGQSQIKGVYDAALGNIGAGYADASRMTQQGYDALNKYLGQNSANPFAGASFTPTTVQDNSQQFMQAYGLDSPEVAQQAATENAYNQAGAGAMNSVYDLLNRAAQASQQSRLSEAQMGQNFANQTLGSSRAAYQAMAAKAQQDQLNELMNTISQQRFNLNQAEGEKGNTLQEELIRLTGVADPETGKAPLTKAENIAQIAANTPNFKEAVKQFAPAYIAKNPKATVAELKKTFPALAKAVAGK
jgi:hypothetical protein